MLPWFEKFCFEAEEECVDSLGLQNTLQTVPFLVRSGVLRSYSLGLQGCKFGVMLHSLPVRQDESL